MIRGYILKSQERVGGYDHTPLHEYLIINKDWQPLMYIRATVGQSIDIIRRHKLEAISPGVYYHRYIREKENAQ